MTRRSESDHVQGAAAALENLMDKAVLDDETQFRAALTQPGGLADFMESPWEAFVCWFSMLRMVGIMMATIDGRTVMPATSFRLYEIGDDGSGAAVEPGDVPPPVAWTSRFMAAAIAGDKDTALALWMAAHNAEGTLLDDCAGYLVEFALPLLRDTTRELSASGRRLDVTQFGIPHYSGEDDQ